jgi:hypothetical protein
MSRTVTAAALDGADGCGATARGDGFGATAGADEFFVGATCTAAFKGVAALAYVRAKHVCHVCAQKQSHVTFVLVPIFSHADLCLLTHVCNAESMYM